MNQDRISINHRTALKMFWDAGFNTESLLIAANKAIENLYQPAASYFYADDVSNLIKENCHAQTIA